MSSDLSRKILSDISDTGVSRKILSDIVVYSKYARYLPAAKRRETWEETVWRNAQMHINKFPSLQDEIVNAYQFVLNRQVLPSMRSLQFGGKPIEISPNRLFNCAYMPIDHTAAFSETMFLLLGGTGVGYSVQKHHVEKLPEILGPKKRGRRYLIGDSIEGWADAVKILVEAYYQNKADPIYDFRDIRPKGALLVTSGGKAPGPQPLKDCLHNIRKVFDRAIEERGIGTQLSTLEVHDIICYIADAVLAGGIRRAALIALFSFDDEDMLTSKFGNWWELNPQRARANNSAVALRHRIKKKDFFEFWEKVKASGCGEPGIFFTNDKEYGLNPSLRRGTRVLTKDGVFNIEDLDGRQFQVKNLYGKYADAKCFLSGRDKPLYEITLSNNKKYYCTAEHKWPILKGKKWKKHETTELKAGMLLPILSEDFLFNGTLGDRDDGFLVGWLYGDGWITDRKDNGIRQYGLIVSEKDKETGILDKLKDILLRKIGEGINFSERNGCYELNFQRASARDYFDKFGVEHKSLGLPSKIWTDCSEEFRKGFIDGLFSSDGSVDISSKVRPLISSSHNKLVYDLQEMLGFYGIKTSIKNTITKGSRTFPNGKTYDKQYSYNVLRINDSDSINHFNYIFSISHTMKQARLRSFGDHYIPTFQRTIKIKSVILTDIKEDVWDISVYDETHCFQLSSCITGNCAEVSLRACQMCNLTTVNVSDVESQEELNTRVRAAAFIGTLQASYTDFHYLRDIWKTTTEKEALLGVSMTGIASGAILKLNLEEAANEVVKENARVAKIIKIKPSARSTVVKPEGTSSLVLGCSSGIHAWHSPFYIRRMRLGKNEPIYKYLKTVIPDLLEDEMLKPDLEAVLSIPIKAPDGAIFRTETAIDLLERGKLFSTKWITPGHISGANQHNVSITVSVKDHEWDEVGAWMWENRKLYNGISVLPYDCGSYKQAPFEECSEQVYNQLLSKCKAIDLSKVVEEEDNTMLKEEAACSAGGCTINKI